MPKRAAPDDDDHDRLLTHSNLVHVATAYARAQGLQTADLGEVLQALTTHTRWIAAHALVRHGVSQYYFDLFRARMTSAPAPVWWDKRPPSPARKRAKRGEDEA